MITLRTIFVVQSSRRDANNTTTETCLCDYHDNIAFTAIEKGAPDFDESNEGMKSGMIESIKYAIFGQRNINIE